MQFSAIPFSKLSKFLFFVSILSVFSYFNAMSQGNLLVNPKRVVFDGNKKLISLNLANTGTDSAKYNISFIQYRMKEDGGFEEITEPDSLQQFADKFLRVFPRTVYLAPNEAQVVKVQLTRTNLLLPGEYRSHLYFRAVPSEKPLGEKSMEDPKGISVTLVPIFGISIPVIIKFGEPDVKINISNPIVRNLEDGRVQLQLQFNRSGSMSSYADLTVNYVSPQGKITQVAAANGLSVYTPNAKRIFVLGLDTSNGINFHEGKLQIEYKNQQDAGGQLLASKELILE